MDGQKIEYIIKKNQRAKRAKILIKENLEVVVSTPPYYTKKFCENFIKENIDFINTHLESFKKKDALIDELIAKNSKKVLIFGEWVEIKNSDKKLKESLREKLKHYLEDRINHFCKIIKVKHTGLKIKKTKCTWGSCTYNNSLNFSLMLIHAPKEVVDYVVVHELCHILHKNHSKSFWSEVSNVIKEHRKLRNFLKENRNFYIKLQDSLNI